MEDKEPMPAMDDERITFRDSAPLLAMHLACLGAFWTGVSWSAVAALLVTYFLRVFALTAGYHRYFSHKSYKTSRAFQFMLAVVGASAGQLGPLWWASHHRHHHQTADTDKDIHSPSRRGFFWSHIGWVLCKRYRATRMERVKDFARYPELMWLDQHPYAPPAGLAVVLFGIGAVLARTSPQLGTSGWQMVMWGFFISTVLVYHVTFFVNSVSHMIGRRTYETADTSRNNWAVALLAMGEGWHNNHHRYSVSARQGFRWWQIDGSYYVLRLLSLFHIVWDIREPPSAVYAEARNHAG